MRTRTTLTDRLAITPEVSAALAEGRPVVALESTLISHGLPYPQNIEVAKASEAAVRAAGAIPATVAINAGRVLVGLDDAALTALATAPAGSVRKAARPSLATALAGRRLGGHDGLGHDDRRPRGGDLGLRDRRDRWRPPRRPRRRRHPAAQPRDRPSTSRPTSRSSAERPWPSSAPARRPSWTCRRPSSTWKHAACRSWPSARPTSPVSTPARRGSQHRRSVPDLDAAADLVAAQLGLGLGAGILICVPVPEADALPGDVARAAVERAIAEATQERVAGPELTPWLLARIAVLTDGASIRANTALIVNDAGFAGDLAVRLAAR